MCWSSLEENWLLAKLEKNKNEKVPGGKRKLTNKMTDRLQNYHGLAIQQNKNNLKGIQSKLKLVYFM